MRGRLIGILDDVLGSGRAGSSDAVRRRAHHHHLLAVGNCIADIQGHAIAGRESRRDLDDIAVIARHGDGTEVHDVGVIDDRDLRSDGAEYQRRGGNLDQTFRLKIEPHLNVQAGQQHVVRIGNVHFDPADSTGQRNSCP
jgi:hypothetical protein